MLTGLEEKILQCVTRYITQNGRSPTLDEIGQLLVQYRLIVGIVQVLDR